ncbi:MAG: prepilin peptidase [Candidatus Peregrinibacteria bacterium]
MDGFLIALIAVLGVVLGSFANVLVARLPSRQSIGGRSRCPSCGEELAVRDLIPVLSYALLGGRCRSCKAPISLRYPIMEIASGALFLLAVFHTAPAIVPGLLLSFFLWLLLTIAAIDAQTQQIPDSLNIPLFFVGVCYAASIRSIVLSCPILAVAFFLLQWLLSRGKWVGSGDILLAAGVGFALGSIGDVLLWLGLSYIIGGCIAAVLLLMHRRKRTDTIAFAPILAFGAAVVLLYGDRIAQGVFP